MPTLEPQIIQVLADTLGLGPAARARLNRDTLLWGALPELDSMAVVGILTALEEALDVVIDDDIGADAFHSVGSLVDDMARRLGR